MGPRIFSFFTGLCLAASLCGCATVSGPAVSEKEITQAREELRVKALDYRFKQLERVCNIGYKLALRLGPNPQGKTYPYFGFVCGTIDKYAQRLFGLDRVRGIVIVAVVDGSPAQKYGIKKGDVIRAVDGKTVADNLSGLLNYLSAVPVNRALKLELVRESRNFTLEVMPAASPIYVNFYMVDLPEVNAAATADNYIIYTYGMVKFAQSDDEIAVVLGHELAHLFRGHVAKMQGAQFLSTIFAVVLGTVAESQSPGSGSAVMRGAQDLTSIFSTKYSRDLENEADYFGILYVYNSGYDVQAGMRVWERFAIELPQSMVANFLATHPSSPERMLRIQKIIQELKGGKIGQQPNY